MPNPQIYTDELELFKSKYKLENYNLYKEQEFAYVNEIVSKGSISINSAAQFINLASATLSICLGANTKINEKGEYISSFNLTEFLTDFEKLADAKYRSELEEDQEPNRKKYAGAKIKALNKAFVKPLEETNKTLPTLWKEDIKKGDMDIDKLQEIVNSSYDKIKGAKEVDKSQMKGEATNVVAAYQAVKQLRESREGFWGWFWKLFNSKINEKEEACYLNLQSKVNDLKKYGVDTEGLLAELNGKTVLGKEIKKVQPKESAKPKVNPIIQSFNPIQFEPCAGKIDNEFAERSKKMVKELLEKFPVEQKSVDSGSSKKMVKDDVKKEKNPKNIKKMVKNVAKGMADLIREQTFETMVVGHVYHQHIKSLNEQFDKGMQNGNQKDAIAKLVRDVFKVAKSASVFATNGIEVDKVEACVIVAQLYVNNLTAVSIYPELGEIAKEYIKDNAALYNEINAKKLSYDKVIDKYAVDYVPNEKYMKGLDKIILEENKDYLKETEKTDTIINDNREKVFDNGNLFAENNANKSASINQPSQHTVPTINNK